MKKKLIVIQKLRSFLNKMEELSTIEIEDKAREILLTWDKKDLISDILELTSKEGLREFINQNG